ncbi:hypothetical protein [Amycolatopsis sp. lyj-112]|uniref:hypothetical protein n=1 Tax=Amycolatopsis sp. lyj-112 TaxID=2789288 RepID=UPI00397B83FC
MGEYPQVRLAWIRSERHREYIVISTTTTRYSLSDIVVSRPATGAVEAAVACGSCESPLRVRVWKLAWFGPFLLVAMIATAAIIRLSALDALDDSTPRPYVLLLANALGLGWVGLGNPVTEDGARLSSYWIDAGRRLRRW